MNKSFVFLLFFFINYNVFSQDNNIISSNYNKNWFVSTAYGIQISGIKPEDFISSNVAPSFLASGGVWFSSEIALQIGYRGFYFHTISDNDKHYYNFIYGEVLLNLNAIVRSNENIITDKWQFLFHSGAGHFYNFYYNRPNICAIFGIINSVKVTNQIDVFVDISAIVGWDIYQGDDDILPSCVFGLSYTFN